MPVDARRREGGAADRGPSACNQRRGRGAWWALAAAAFVPAAPAADPPGLVVSERVAHYGVFGDTAKALRNALSQGIHGHGEGPSALTLSQLEVEFQLEAVPGGCRVAEFRVGLDLTVTLPEWRPARRPRTALAAQWDRLYRTMAQHEARHREHALDAAANLHARLLAAPRDIDCHALERLIGAAHHRELVRLRMRDRLFDLRDRHALDLGMSP